MDILPIILCFLSLIEGCLAASCRYYSYYRNSYARRRCASCCGDYNFQTCCTAEDNIGMYVGISVGFFALFVILFIVCICIKKKQQAARGAAGLTMSPPQQQPMTYSHPASHAQPVSYGHPASYGQPVGYGQPAGYSQPAYGQANIPGSVYPPKY